MNLEHGLDGDAAPTQMLGRAASREQLESHFLKPSCDRGHRVLVGVVDGNEERAPGREHVVRRQLRLAECAPERVRDSHHFARRPHLGAKDRVELAEFVEREHRFLDRDVGRCHLFREPDLVERLAEHYPRGNRGQRNADRLRDKWHGPARSRIHLEDVHLPVLDRVLNVDQTHYVQCLGKGDGVLPHLIDVLFVDQVRWQHARRIAGVDPGVLDVLHHSADHDAFAVRDRVDIGLERILEKAVDQHRLVLGDAGSPHEVLPQRRFVVDDFHCPTAQHIRWTH